MRYFIYVLIIFLLACTANAKRALVFNKPQPENLKNLSTFPLRYRGTFRGKDSVLLLIDKTKIIYKYAFVIDLLKSELDSFPEITYANGLIHYVKSGDSFPALERRDTLFWKEQKTDTIFYISKKQVVRKLAGYVVLNTEQDSAEWKVDLLKLDFGTLKFIKIDSKEDLAKFNQIINPEIKSDTISQPTSKTILNPTKKEFRAFLKIREFNLANEYKRVW